MLALIITGAVWILRWVFSRLSRRFPEDPRSPRDPTGDAIAS